MTTTTTRTSSAVSGFGHATGLSCRECGRVYELGPHYACEECFGPLEVCYDYPRLTREEIQAGPPNMWRYAPLLPVPPDIAERPTTEPGYTKLIRADNLAHALGMRRLWIKDDRGNPTHSFKDRVVAVALAAATEMGFKVLACPSTGNRATAVAAAAARAGIRSVVMVPADLEQQKIITTSVYGGTFITVDGTYDGVNRLASELAGEHPAAWAPNTRHGASGTRPSEVSSPKPLSTLTSCAPDAIGTTTCSGSRQPSCSATSYPSVFEPSA